MNLSTTELAAAAPEYVSESPIKTCESCQSKPDYIFIIEGGALVFCFRHAAHYRRLAKKVWRKGK